MDNQNTNQQLIDQYLDGTLSDGQLDLFNDKIRLDKTFREEVAFQTTLRKSVRKGKIDNWKNEWEEGQKRKRRIGWWIWPIGIGLIGLLVFMLIPRTDKTNLSPDEIAPPIQSPPPTIDGETEPIIDPDPPIQDEPPTISPPKSGRQDLASLDLRAYSQLKDYPATAIITKSSNDPDAKLWRLPENEASTDSLRQLQLDLSTFLASNDAPEDVAKLKLLLAYLQHRAAEYSLAEENFKAILQSEAFEVHDVARWYLALSLIKQNKVTEAKKLLKTIIDFPGGGHFMEGNAKELMKILS